MYPSLLAEETKQAITEYLATTFALADDDTRRELQSFLQNPSNGIFQGPYLRLRTPFESATGTRSALSWTPEWFTPYRHQERAFGRLSSFNQASEPTIVTTGTGSGKTEAFLLPLLDHARRAKARGEEGIKALILYPMNALVTDQAARIARLLHDEPELSDVTAGVYIGGSGQQQKSTRDALVDNRDILRENPPDILLTNYKMLDLLLLRSQDAALWSQARSSLHCVVLDEFHTYDGAQGTDVAMLLRRLGSTLNVASPSRPLGRITPVATSATLGGGTRADELCDFAETIFGTRFGPDSVITEERLDAQHVTGNIDFSLELPDITTLTEISERHDIDADDDTAWHPIADAFFAGSDQPPIRDRFELADRLRTHFLTGLVTQELANQALPAAEAVERITRAGALKWGMTNQDNPVAVQYALLQFLTLISAARTHGPAGPQPFLQVEVQLWIREVSRMLRGVSTEPKFAWWDDGLPETNEHWLPAVFCRACGRSGWQARQPELGTALEASATAVWRSSVNPTERAKQRTIIQAGSDDPDISWLHPGTLEVSRTADHDQLPVLVTADNEAAKNQRCPSCGANDAIRFLGSAVATLASVALTQAFGSQLIPDGEKKTLVFTDSVQDAAHRAAFIEGRAFTFNFRSLLYRVLDGEPTSLDVAAVRLAELDADELYALAPPDFTNRLGLEGEWLTESGAKRARKLLATRLAFQAHLETGLRSRSGRTLELTGTLGIHIDADLEAAAATAREIHENLPKLSLAEPPEQIGYQRWIAGILNRLRSRGGILHPWLDKYINDDGRRWAIWGASPKGMQKFPSGRAAPIFYTTAGGTQFDALIPRADSWLTNWTIRSLGVGLPEAKALLNDVVPHLAGEGKPLEQRSTKKDGRAYGIKPEHVILAPLESPDLAAGDGLMVCDECEYLQPVSPQRSQLWAGAACPRMKCPGHLVPKPDTEEDFYRNLYRSGRVRRIVAKEHTGLLEPDDREGVESRFKAGDRPIDPNILTCTPTLELGIDIGDLSTVTLSSLPRNTASYLQRVGRAGRSTGNAFITATVPSRPRDLYYFAEPRNLINGDVRPPGAYLNATELLQRQFNAFCFDKVANGHIRLASPMPNQLGGLIGNGLADGTWLRSFLNAVAEQSDRLQDEFVALFGELLDEDAISALKEYANQQLESHFHRTINEWTTHRYGLDERIRGLADSIAALDATGHLDDSQREDRRRWSGELKGLQKARASMGRQESFTGLSQLGLLPNYNLVDDSTTLDVQLWWTSDDAQPGSGEATFHTAEHSIARGSRAALTELAPGATFYAYGSKVEIDAVDIGHASSPDWFTMRLCPDCGWGTDDYTRAISACPRCHSRAAADMGARHTVLPLRRVSAVHHRDESVVDDDTEDRVRTQFTTITGVSIDPDDIASAWRLKDTVFGAEYVRLATIRSLNVGKTAQPGGEQVVIAGQKATAPGFRTCARCGVVWRHDRHETKHRGWCPTRRSDVDPQWTNILLSHELDTQAVRLLLPMSTLHIESRLASFSAALQIGLRSDFGGDPQHLSIVTASLPDSEGHRRQFVVLHDLVPGGTGYLDRFGRPDDLRRILIQARDILERCPCKDVAGQRSCHRCLLSVANPTEVASLDRELALSLLAEILDNWEPEPLSTVTDIQIRDVVLSELEVRFREELKRWVDANAEAGHSYEMRLGPHGEELDLKLASDEQLRHWHIEQQTYVHGEAATTPDLMITRQDAQSEQIAIYLDGQQFHASVENNRTADDARKRDGLRQDGYRVWSITWDDVDAFAAALDGRPRDEAPLRSAVLSAHVNDQVADRRVKSMWANPIDFLLAYLTDPDTNIWARAAEQSVLGLLATSAHGTETAVAVRPDHAHDALLALARGQTIQADESGLVLVSRRGISGLPLFVIGDPTGGDPTTALGILAVLDDTASNVGGSTHEQHWRDWLRWANIAQFLRHPGFADDTPDRMAAFWTTQSLEQFAEIALPAATMSPSTASPQSEPTDAWRHVIEFTDASLSAVAVELGEIGVPIPEPGAELGPQFWPVEMAWESEKVAVIIDDNIDRDTWLADNGWLVIRSHMYETPIEVIQEILAAMRRT